MAPSKQRTITLTNAAPVRISESLWPVVAVASDHDGQIEAQANRTWSLRVREHADGRRIVYGVHGTCFQNERDASGGEIVPAGGDVVAAIRRVNETIGGSDYLANSCIADLPAVPLDDADDVDADAAVQS